MRKNKRVLFMVLLPLIFGLGSINSIIAQTVYHSLKLTVSVETGESVENADVKLENTYTGMVYNKTLPADGKVEYSKLVEGTYKLTITKVGLPSYINNNIVLDRDLDLAIEIQENKVTPYGLKSSVTYNENTGNGIVDLSWNNDNDAFFDDFESYDPFSISFSPWSGIDGDKDQLFPLDITFPNYLAQQYATIFNPAKTTPSRLGFTEMMPYSGLQCIAFFRTKNIPNNDWVVAPKKLIKEGDIVSFMAKALGVNYADEQFRVAISTTNNTDIKSFKTISKGNSESATGTWTKFEYDLSEYAGQEVYIAINYISVYKQMLMVDDLFIGKKTTKSSAIKARRVATNDEYPQYVVYLDGTEKATLQTTSYQLGEVPSGAHTLGVKAVYKSGATPIETLDISIEDKSIFASVTLNVTTNNEVSTEGMIANLYNTDSGQNYRKEIIGGKVSIPYAQKGKYEITINAKGFEVYNESLNLVSNIEKSILLKEIITKPYNLTVDLEKGEDNKYKGDFIWNQDLGWSDGFESYADFTQKPSPWLTYDLDGIASYGASINGFEFVFPGAKAAMGPIVFNPSKTQPAVDQYETTAAPEGDKYIAFISAQMAKSNDWLISPVQEIKQNYVLRFTLKSLNMAGIVDSVNVSLSESANVKDFKVVSRIMCDNEQWIKYEVPLNDYAGKSLYVGFNFVSYDGFFAQLDDVYVGPKETSSDDIGNVVEFEIYLDNALVAKVPQNKYQFQNLEAGKTYKAGVKSIYKTGTSDLVEVEFSTANTSINTETNNQYFRIYPTIITDNLFNIESGSAIKEVSIYNMAGVKVLSITGNNETKMSIVTTGLLSGLYIVRTNCDNIINSSKILIK